MNTEKLFPVVAEIVYRARYSAWVSAVNIELNFGSDANSLRFPAVSAPATPISLSEPSVYMCFHPLYLFSTTSINIFW